MNLVVTAPSGVGREPGVGAGGADDMVFASNANTLSNASATSFAKSQAGTQRSFAETIAISNRETMNLSDCCGPKDRAHKNQCGLNRGWCRSGAGKLRGRKLRDE